MFYFYYFIKKTLFLTYLFYTRSFHMFFKIKSLDFFRNNSNNCWICYCHLTNLKNLIVFKQISINSVLFLASNIHYSIVGNCEMSWPFSNFKSKLLNKFCFLIIESYNSIISSQCNIYFIIPKTNF